MEYKIKEIADIKSGKRLPKGMEFSSEKTAYGYIRARDIKERKIKSNSLVYIDESVRARIKKYIINKDDIAITIVGENIGDVGICSEELDNFNLTENAVRLTNYNKKIVDPIYLSYYLNQNFMKEYMKLIGSGAAQGKLGIYKIEKIKVELPSIEGQKEVANILLKYDNLIDTNNKKIVILEKMAEEIYKEWFIKLRFPGYQSAEFENGMPKGWQVKKVKDCVKRMNFGITYKAEELETEGNVIVIDQSKEDYLGFHNNEPSHKADLDNPIMLFGDHSCKTKIMIKDFSLGENVIPYISNDNGEINNYYLYYATKRLIETEEYKRHWSRFCGFKILVPSIVFQNNFMKYIKRMEQEKELLWQKNQNLIKQRDLLLPRLMSGKLEVK